MQSRLLMQTIGIVVAVWFGAVGIVWWDTQHELDELFDAHLCPRGSDTRDAAGGRP